ncbi:expressed unknown protein [Seminavis robusta]|uniref:Uncharacterized protein n=1 Tax=Seminavis robusta TaxID=568900 RepID=A0A9N8DGF2_9STRA|nr:expressed unknown protein [Seminavis robusta]|eukprot:Sro107_g053760.1 n/a (193) ;mRNA; r:24879-25457
METRSLLKVGQASSITRLLFFMQFANVAWDFGYITGMTMTPRGTIDYPGTLGTQATCTLQGMALYFGSIAVALYDIVVSIFYVLLVRFSWPPSKLERYEKVPILIWPISLAIALIPIFQKTYNFNWGVCLVQTVPFGCSDQEGTCIRGLPTGFRDDAACRQLHHLGCDWLVYYWNGYHCSLHDAPRKEQLAL